MKNPNNDNIAGNTLGLGARIKLIREELGLSLSRFGEKLSNNSRGAIFKKSLLSKYERGENMPGSEFYIALIEVFGVDTNWVLSGIGKQFVKSDFVDKSEPIDYEAVTENLNKYIKKAE